jgi:hypothetical protein
MKKHQFTAHQTQNLPKTDLNINHQQKIVKMQNIVQQNVHQRFVDFEKERRRFQSFSELYFQQQRSAFQYVCHPSYR